MNKKEKLNQKLINILYVEDDSDDQQIFQEGLDKVAPNISCHFATSADEAWQVLNTTNTSVDCVFLDINLPGMDGISLLSEIKNENDFKSIPVFMYSTSNNNKHIHTCKDLGAEEYIVKPDTFTEVCKILNRHCSELLAKRKGSIAFS